MRMLTIYCLIACGTLAAQQSRRDDITETTSWLEKLRADLSGVMSVSKLNQERAFRMAVADDIMSLADPAHRPPETLVQEFAHALTGELSPRGWPVRRL